jgi:Bifunctional DNA primase/polymerase, N-terminal
MHPPDIVFDLHRRGLWLVPTDPQTKVPLLPWAHVDDHGFPAEPTFRESIIVGSSLPYSTWLRFWSSTYPGCGWAVLTGRSKLLVLDCDPQHGGDVSLRRLCEEVTLPATFMIRTPHGAHLYYRVERPVRSTVSVLAPGLDIRSHRALATVPPTPNYSIWDDRPIAPAPIELLKRCPKPIYGTNKIARPRLGQSRMTSHECAALLDDACAKIVAALPGVRHDTVYGQARRVLKHTGDLEADRLLLKAALENGLPAHEAARCITDARRRSGW